MEAAAEGLLLWGLLPAWLAAGLLDWWCHRRTDIAHTSGVKESALHLLMMLQVGLAVCAVLFLKINTGVLLLLTLLWLLHQATSVWDSRYASPRRKISILEQHAHGFLDVLPLLGLVLVSLLHWRHWVALFQPEGNPPEFSLTSKSPSWPHAVQVSVLGAALLFAVMPFLQEWWMGRRAQKASFPISPAHVSPPARD